MIRSAIFKLTLAYLGVFMALSVAFSFALYNISSRELNRSLRGPETFAFRVTGNGPTFDEFRLERLEESRSHLQGNLILLNIAMLGLGAAVSYILAQRTLGPIEEVMEAQSRFTADASHELRTPLTAMQTEIEVALRDPKLSKKEIVNLLKSNLEEVAKLKTLSESLLRLARADSGLSVSFSPVVLHDVIKDALQKMRPLADKKGITLINSTSTAKVLGDYETLVELCVILIDNAIKYSDEKTTVSLTDELHGKYLILHVSDEGRGIAEKDIPHIFDRFYRADVSRTKNVTSGYGLGLSIAKQITDMHKGDISVTSVPKKGSTFHVFLPLS